MAKKPEYKHVEFLGNSQKKSSSVPVEKTTAITDLHLWQEFKTGSELAFATIYEQYVAKLFSYGLKLVYNKELVKDTIQDLFIELWDAKDRLANVQSIKAYLYRSLRRKIIANVSKARKTIDESQNINNLNRKTVSAEINLIEKQRFEEQRQALQKALTMLTDNQKEIIYLKFYSRLSYNEIAEIMSLNKKGTYNLMARTIKLLKEHLVLVLFVLIGML